jgi:PKD repeat protein
MYRDMAGFLRRVCAVIVAVLTLVTAGAATAGAANHRGATTSAVPSDRTPHVLDYKVIDIAEVGDRIVVAGNFTKVQDAKVNGEQVFAQKYVFAFDKATGRIDRAFRPVVSGVVNTVEAGPGGTVYLGGTFRYVNGVVAPNLVQVSLATGALVNQFRVAGINGAVSDLALVGGRLFAGGYFNQVGTARHGGLATVNPVTGAVDEYLGVDVTVNHNWPDGVRQAVGVSDFDISPDGSRMVAIGNFTLADGQIRDQVVSVLLGPGGAVVDPNWRTRRYEPACDKHFYDFYVRDVDFSPDGSHFVIVTTSGGHEGTLCDTAARWDTRAMGLDVQPRWVAETGADTLHSVAVTDAAVYIGGHQRWMNNPDGWDVAGPGAVPRPGIAALDPRTGIPLSWNPGRNPRGIGAETLLATSSGLYVGMDTKYFGNYKYLRQRLGFFPLAGGATLPSEDTGALPAGVLLAGRTTSAPGVNVNDVRTRFFDGTSAGGDKTSVTAGTSWSLARGAVRIGDTLFYGYPGSDGKYALFRRSFDGTTFGAPTRVDPYNDPYWSTVKVKWRTTYISLRGMLPGFYGTQLSTVTAMAYRDGRLYYTRGNAPQLFYRHFSPDSGIVSQQEYVAAGSGFDYTSGLILSGGDLFVADSRTGDLRRTAFANGAPSGTGTVVSGPAKDGRDWRTRAMFLGSRPDQPPVASFTSSCLELTCTFDGRGSTDAEGPLASYAWDFGDGTTGTGPTASHTYVAEGTHTVRLTVTDGAGGTASTTAAVTVAAPADEGTGTRIAFRDAAGVSTPAVSKVSLTVPASVREGDGLVMVLSTNSTATGTPPAGWQAVGRQVAGTAMTTEVFTKVATAADAGSAVTVPLSASVKASLQLAAYSGTAATGPVASVTSSTDVGGRTHTTPAATAAQGNWVLSVWSDKSATADAFAAPSGVAARSNVAGVGTGGIATLLADSGAGVPAGPVGGLAATVPTDSSRATMFTVLLAPGTGVTETAPAQEPAAQEPAAQQPAVEEPAVEEPAVQEPPANQPPVAEFASSCAELACTFDASTSSDPDGTVAAYAWDFGDGVTATGPTAEHTYAAAGDHQVTLTVTDDDGATTSATSTVPVAPAPSPRCPSRPAAAAWSWPHR